MSEPRAVVDSSGWIEVFTDGPVADRFLRVLAAEDRLVVPAISILEVFKWVLREHSEAQAIQAAAAMQRGVVVDLDSHLAIATARSHGARLYTMDADFRGLEDVELMARRS
jgi:predicted nucleic acid-binding protein